MTGKGFKINRFALSAVVLAVSLVLAQEVLSSTRSDFAPTVTVGGRAVQVYPVVLSAGQINKVFDGRQRDPSQTKRGWALTCDIDSASRVVIDFAKKLPDDIVVRPLGRRKDWLIDGMRLVIPVEGPEQVVVNSPSGGIDDVHVFVNAPFVSPRPQGKVRRFGRGVHRPGLIAPESNETIILDEGAVVHAEVFMLNVTNVTVCGRGTFDFSEWERADSRACDFREKHGLPTIDTEFACNPFTIYGCKDIRVEGVTLVDAPFWTVIVRNGSRNVDIGNIKIVGNWRYNSDGINVQASSDVRVHDSFVRSFDDCLVARAPYMEGDDGLPTENLLFERNVLWCDWGKNCEVWSGHKVSRMRNITFRQNACVQVSFMVCDVTTWYGSADTQISNVAFEDIEIDVVKPRWKAVFQTAPSQAFNVEMEDGLNLLTVDSRAPAKNLGNQHFEAVEDASGYKLRYEGIRFRGVRLFGDDPGCLTVNLGTATAYQKIRGVDLQGLPPGTLVSQTGNVELIRKVD